MLVRTLDGGYANTIGSHILVSPDIDGTYFVSVAGVNLPDCDSGLTVASSLTQEQAIALADWIVHWFAEGATVVKPRWDKASNRWVGE